MSTTARPLASAEDALGHSSPHGLPGQGSGPSGDPVARPASPRSSASRPLPSPSTGAVQGELFPRPAPRLPLRTKAIVPGTLDEALSFARAVVAARMAPAGFDTAEACMIAILHGMEVGLTPLSALQRIAVIGGRPTIWGDGAMALVRASGLAASIDERIEGNGPSDWVAVCTVRRRGDPHAVERRFSVEDAKRARLWGKAGPWSDYPQRMLQMRARAFALRDVFADVLGGLYLREEIEDGEETIQGMDGAWAQLPHAPSSEVIGDPSIPAEAHATTNPDAARSRNDAPQDRPASPGPAPLARAVRPKIIAPPPPPLAEEVTAPTPDLAAAQASALSVEAAQRDKDARPSTMNASTRPRAALTARRRTSDARAAQRLRFENGWAIRRPRTLATRTTSPVVNRTRIDNGNRPRPDRGPISPATGSTSPADVAPSPSSTATASSPHEVLQLYDDALSCARDAVTLDEIVEEFAARLATLDRNGVARAQHILARHRHRVAALAVASTPDRAPSPDGGGP